MHLHLSLTSHYLAVPPWWWAGLGLAAVYVCWAVLTASRADPNQILVPGAAARARVKRTLAAIPVAALLAGGYVLAHDHYQHARVVASATQVSPRAELLYGWAGLTAGIAIVLIVVSSVITRHRTPLPAAAAGRRRGRRGRRGRGEAEWAQPSPYYPPGNGYLGGYQPLPPTTTRRGRRG